MKFILSLFMGLVLFTGCSTTKYTIPISSGIVENPDIVITATDGSFKLSGEFQSPFQSSTHYHSLNISGSKLINGYRRALQYGARHVRVKVPSIEKELYGVLVLDKADKDAIGPAKASYKIIIPEAYVNAAIGGKISVVYEYYHINSDTLFDLSDVKKYSWLLWISDEDIFQ